MSIAGELQSLKMVSDKEQIEHRGYFDYPDARAFIDLDVHSNVELTIDGVTRIVFPATRVIKRVARSTSIRNLFRSQLALIRKGLGDSLNGPFLTTAILHAFIAFFSEFLEKKLDYSKYSEIASCYLRFSEYFHDSRVSYEAALDHGLVDIGAHEDALLTWMDQIELAGKTKSEREIYRDRSEKSEAASDFLFRVYKDLILTESLTLADLQYLDKSLWTGLRNQARYAGKSVEIYLPKGHAKRGPKIKDLEFDQDSLDESDPRDAALLQALRRRKSNREAAARRRAYLNPK